MTSQVGLYSAHLWYPIGAPAVFHSFFSTICLILESGSWGQRFPVLMNDLYAGAVHAESVSEALKEAEVIKDTFIQLPPDLMIWDCENPETPVPDNYEGDLGATSLADCFVTSEKEKMVDVLERGLRQATLEGQDIAVTTLEALTGGIK